MDALAGGRELRCKGGSRAGFTALCVLLFLAGVAVAVERCAAMAAMGAMPMAGGGTLSMTWVRMCGQSWSNAAMSFLGVWMAMTVAMMTPVLAPALWRVRRGLGEASLQRCNARAAVAAAAYFLVWGVLGLAVYPLGAAGAVLALKAQVVARLIPHASAVILAGAGMLQLSSWKRRRLEDCRHRCAADESSVASVRQAWRQGLHLGLHCTACCAPLTLAMLVLGAMDLRVMTAAAVAIAAERLAPGGLQLARASGVLMLAAAWVLARSAVGA